MKKFYFLIVFLAFFYSLDIYCQLTTSLEEYYKFDETSGAAINSVSPGTNNSSSMTAVQGVTGKIGNAYSFDGVSQRVDFADHANWTIMANSTLSISAWIYLTGDVESNGYGNIWGMEDGPEIFIHRDAPGTYKLGWYTGNALAETNVMSFSFNTWYHIVMTKNSSTINFYRNNVNVGTITTTDNDINPLIVYIGSDTHNSKEAFKGNIDELGIWKRVLSASEVSTLYNSGSGLTYPFGTTNYTLTATASPTAGGTITLNPADGSYASGTSVTITANPASGYSFSGWSGAVTGTTNPATITMNANKTVTATFTANTGGGNWQTSGSNIYYSSGKVSIGTNIANSSSALTVNGKILAKEVEVVSSITSDYVFEPGYQLLPLTDLETFLKKNKHLPGIPSAKEFSEQGQNLGKTDDLLLRKIEELTLYIVEQNKKILELQNEVNALKSSKKK